MEPCVIHNKSQYEVALNEIDGLIALDPESGTPEGDRLDLLALLIETYENEHFKFRRPGPIEAIKFRMEEQGLQQRNLIPYIGSKSKVSEILSGKRSLTLPMVRALSAGLGISADILIQDPIIDQAESFNIEWEKFPLKEMIKRRWIDATLEDLKDHTADLLASYFAPLGDGRSIPILTRCTFHQRSGKEMDRYALMAWTARVISRAKSECCFSKYITGTVDDDFIRKVGKLSWSNQGPVLAKEFLAKKGIALVIEPNLPKTKLDGASMLTSEGMPVIGLTIRYDRIDSFWFTLIHELVHVSRHLTSTDDTFIDDLEVEAEDDPREREADVVAKECLIPKSKWTRSPAFRQRTPEAITELANVLSIHPAIIAGRIRYEKRNYKILNQMVGHGEVRKLFDDEQWKME